MVTAKQRANLRPAKKGEIRNPLGINRKRPWTDRIFAQGETLLIESPEGRKWIKKFHLPKTATWADAAAYRTILEAVKGNIKAFTEAANRTEGKPPQRIELSGPERKEITIRIVHDRTKPVQS